MVSRFRELDALRGIAALFVVLFHFTMNREVSKYGFHLGVTGVDLFFIISGFVIFMSIQKVSSVLEFAVNRFTRLYPTYWTCVTITFLFVIYNLSTQGKPEEISTMHYLANMTMFQYNLRVPNLDGSYWTMIFEMGFYVFIGLLFSVNRLKNIIPIGVGVLCLVAAYELLPDSGFANSFNKLLYYVPFFRSFPLFFAGIVFYKITTSEKTIWYYYLLIIGCFAVQIIPHDNGAFITHPEYISMLAVYFILFFLFAHHKLNFIISKPTLFLGKISFALYLIHQYICYEVIIPRMLAHGFSFWLAASLSLLFSIGVATIITFYIEIPFGKRINNRLRIVLGLKKKQLVSESK